MKIPTSAVAVSLLTLVGLVTPPPAGAQLTLSGICAPGVPGCGAVRFFLAWDVGAMNPLILESLGLSFPGSSWFFAGGPLAAFAASDDIAVPFSGDAQVSSSGMAASAGDRLFIDFLGQGSSFELLPGSIGYVQVPVVPGATSTTFLFDAKDLDQNLYTGTGLIPISTVPEPVSALLLGTGLAALAGVHRRRKTASG